MEYTADQENALTVVNDWWSSDRQNVYVAGYAGTGKTELAQVFSCNKDTVYVAFTGKATSVLKARGCEPARTIHSLIYRPAGSTKKREEELRELLKDEALTIDDRITYTRELEELLQSSGTSWKINRQSDILNYELVIVDECSMVSQRLGEDLTSFGKKVLWLGDPGQLPPVHGRPCVSRPPNAMLETIHRQAAQSGIVQAATLVRKGEDLTYQDYGADMSYVYKGKFDWDAIMGADQVIVGKNLTRHRMIKNMRAREGKKDWMPVEGDRLIVLKNDYEYGIFNGVSCTCKEVVDTGTTLEMLIEYEGRDIDVEVDSRFFQESYDPSRKPDVRGYDRQHIGFGHAITIHKSQGSQWPSIVVCDDKMRVHDAEFRRKLMYTAITRAQHRCIVYA